SVAFHPTKPLLATGSGDQTVKLWSFSDDWLFPPERLDSTSKPHPPTLVATLAGHIDWVNSVAFHPTLLLLASGSEDSTVRLWRLSCDNSSATCEAISDNLSATCVAISDNLSATSVATLAGPRISFLSVAFHPTAPLLATGSNDNTVRLWLLSPDNSSATSVATLEGHGNLVLSVAFHPTAPLLATGSSDNTAKLWLLSSDNSSANVIETMVGHERAVESVAFHPTAPLLATGSDDRTVILWNYDEPSPAPEPTPSCPLNALW
ncbi:MAG: WD40 repeat domain-containing protein, partial [Nitrosomonadaceae bacterium]|nr:WD40 repeat domain-containing protein [Nitrosomonadaceae bacterium]